MARTTRVAAPRASNELHTADLAVAEAPPADIDQRSETIIPVDKPLEKDYAAALAFMEEPITILIEPSDEENAPLVVDCWVNGKGAEILDAHSGKWLEINCLPIGGVITTKRKYVEVLARSRSDRVDTTEETNRPDPGKDGYRLNRKTLRKSLFSVIEDKNPKGVEWLKRLHAER